MDENLNNNQQQTMKEPKKQEPSLKTKKNRAKVVGITLSAIVVLFIGLQVYASTNGYGNVFFMIRDWTTSKNVTGQDNVFNEEMSKIDDKIQYEISKKSNTVVTIKATKNGKTISKDIELTAEIADTGTMEIQSIGTVALVAESGGEYYGVAVFQLVDNEIKKIGHINCGIDMVKDATYTVKTKGEGTVIIDAKTNKETITKEIEMTAAIDKTEVANILKCGKVVFVSEAGGEYHAVKVFRASKDYTTGKIKEIKEVGTIQNNTDYVQLESIKEGSRTTNTNNNNTDADFFEKNANIQYYGDLTNPENGKAAIIKSGEEILKTTQNTGYYTYTDMWNNSYNIKKIKDVKSEFTQLGKDKQSALYKCTIYYIDNNNQDKSFDVAVIVAKDAEGGIIGTYDNYTGSTRYTRWSGLYDEDSTENSQLEPDNYAEEVSKYEKDTKGYIGTWKVKKAYNDTKEVSLQEVYGTSVKYGVGNLSINMDGTFTDKIAPLYESEDLRAGKYISSNNSITLTYNNGSKKSISYNPVDDIITYNVFDNYYLIMEKQGE